MHRRDVGTPALVVEFVSADMTLGASGCRLILPRVVYVLVPLSCTAAGFPCCVFCSFCIWLCLGLWAIDLVLPKYLEVVLKLKWASL